MRGPAAVVWLTALLFALSFLGSPSVSGVSSFNSSELGIAEVSPAGLSGGAIIPASCESGFEHFAAECSGICFNGAVNAPLCTLNSAGNCINGSTNPPTCTLNSAGNCINGSTNPPTCTLNSGGNGSCINGGTNPPACTLNSGGSCVNSGTNPPICNAFCNRNGVCQPGETLASCPADCFDIPVVIENPNPSGTNGITPINNGFAASPNPVLYNRITNLSWNATGATICTVIGIGISGKETDRFTAGASGTRQSSKLIENTDFTLSCSNNRNGYATKTIRVRVINPGFKEF